LWFYNTGLGGKDGVNSRKWSLKTFPTLLHKNNHTEVCTLGHKVLDNTYQAYTCKHSTSDLGRSLQ